jgi:hypothetical protein
LLESLRSKLRADEGWQKQVASLALEQTSIAAAGLPGLPAGFAAQ